MEMGKLKVLTVGDIHGREIWKDFIFGSIEKFEDWALECSSGDYVRPWEETLDLRFSDIDKVVFVGDYFDSFDVNNVIMKKNAEDLFLFKRCYPDRVEMLWGNHDVSYWYKEEACSGFRGEMYVDFHEILYANKDNLKVAFQIGNVLWSHAGVTDSFYKKLMLKEWNDDVKEHERWVSLGDETHEKPDLSRYTIANFLNFKWYEKWRPLFNVGKRRGGFDLIPGPLWADQAELQNDMLNGVFQFVGHTPVPYVKGTYDANHGVCFLDCLERRNSKGVVVVEIQDDKYVNYQVIEETKI